MRNQELIKMYIGVGFIKYLRTLNRNLAAAAGITGNATGVESALDE